MGKGRPRAVETGQNLSVSSAGSFNMQSGPVYYPSEEEFRDPLEYIYTIRPEAEPYGICKIVPPKTWSPLFALNVEFLEGHCGKKLKKSVIFEGEELDLCKLFNAVRRYGGYDKVVKGKKWAEVFRFVRSWEKKISECAKHVLCQLYREHLYDYEAYYKRLSQERAKSYKRGIVEDAESEKKVKIYSCKRRRKNSDHWNDMVCKVEDEDLDQICEQCRSGLHGEVMLLCDRCNKWWHIYCLSPPLKQVPLGNWYCFECLNSDKDSFGFIPGKQFTLEAFRRLADRAKKKWFGSGCFKGTNREKVLGDCGGFGRSPWNLNNLPKLKGSMLRAVHHNITGVMVPWLGEPKCWYSVPGNEASAFEKVMRDCLPDLFDAQPDLLFQLVTMLNPSVLQENGVPVYSVLQEPGNFVITFPRSYHGGFNLGLNCAEAVNFAPADWLPHGGSGAELYQLYRKAAVLSHEELLCVVAKDMEGEAWLSGIKRSSPMSPRNSPEFVGTEEDPTCIICKQYLYLSAVVCRCRPSAFVCLEHWEHLCECKSSKLLLLYRYTLAELADLVLMVDKHASEETPQNDSLQRNISSSKELNVLKRRHVLPYIALKISLETVTLILTAIVKGAHVTHTQLAEQWLSRSCKILQSPFDGDACTSLLKGAEQFLWAGAEMDSVRDMVKNLTAARKWAQGIRDCLSKIENWYPGGDFEKVTHKLVNKLLSVDPVPCNEPGYLKLKDFAEEGNLLVQDIDAALSTCSKINELELLYSRACSSPIHVAQSEKLSQKISCTQVWVDNARKAIFDEWPAAVEVDILYKLKSEDVEVLLQEMTSFSVNIPELRVLKQYQIDASFWITRFNGIMININQREDRQSVIDELNCLLEDGESLKIQVDELSLVKIELKKACCREKAMKARNTKMALDFLQQLLADAVVLQIETEELFLSLSRELERALQWEERAKDILACKAQMSEFEDLIRMSNNIVAIMPSLDDVQTAISVANLWLNNSKQFLESDFSESSTSRSLLKLDDLKELASQLRFHKMTLINKMSNGLILKIEHLVNLLESVTKAGLSLGLDFPEIPKLQNACSTLHWCNKVLSFCYLMPSYEDVESLMNSVENLSIMHSSGSLLSSLIFGAKWLKNVSEVISAPIKCNACKLTDAEECLLNISIFILAFPLCACTCRNLKLLYTSSGFGTVIPLILAFKLRICQGIRVAFPMMFAQLMEAACKHRLWQEQVNRFFSLELMERSWSQFMQLEEYGKASFFTCEEVDMVLSEVAKIEKWKQRCRDAIRNFVGDESSTLCALQKIKESLDRSLYVYEKSKSCEGVCLYMCCINGSEDWDFVTCSACKDCYHLLCLGYRNNPEVYTCSYCKLLAGGLIPPNRGGFLGLNGKYSDLELLSNLVSVDENLCVRIDERDILQQIVDQAYACRKCLTEIVDFEISCYDKDQLTYVIAIQVNLISWYRPLECQVYDHQSYCDLERALARCSWRFRVARLLDALEKGLEKPSIQQIDWHLKENYGYRLFWMYYFRLKLSELKDIGLQWAGRADKVAADSGALGLDGVYELITEGESLPVCLRNELEVLRVRSMLHCICRKPYEKKTMIVCSQCEEWYHVRCVKLTFTPKVYICAACMPGSKHLVSSLDSSLDHERYMDSKLWSRKPRLRDIKNREWDRRNLSHREHRQLERKVVYCSTRWFELAKPEAF
ncbi:lysine-specific demethylase 5A-like isoform X2 [Hibiscus syriacus]|uniref:Lysine-specific demethylase 5A-like isoform X2 n=1 Tax=Hibiscus syriacus TaxID=106335 RepID=A0A6A2Y7E9_HIBSY|nr:lysine-specific demethylase 5A-like isoform X2 [Hibiscus syriacus]